MVAEKKYKTLDGSVMEEAEAKELFGDDLETMIALGQLEIVGDDVEQAATPMVEETDTQEEVKSDTYITNDGTELTTEEAMDYFGNSLEDMVSLGELKKKEEVVATDSTSVESDTTLAQEQVQPESEALDSTSTIETQPSIEEETDTKYSTAPLDDINLDLLKKTEEEVVATLKDKYKAYGFTVSEEVPLMDVVQFQAYDKSVPPLKIKLSPGAFTDQYLEEGTKMIEMLQKYIMEHSIDSTTTQTEELKEEGFDIQGTSLELDELLKEQQELLKDPVANKETLDKIDQQITDLEKARIVGETDKYRTKYFEEQGLDYSKLSEADKEIQKLEAEIKKIEESPEDKELKNIGFDPKFQQLEEVPALSAEQKKQVEVREKRIEQIEKENESLTTGAYSEVKFQVDKKLEQVRRVTAENAVRKNDELKTQLQEVQNKTIGVFGVPLDKLQTLEFTSQEQVDKANSLLKEAYGIQNQGKVVGQLYSNSGIYFDQKQTRQYKKSLSVSGRDL